jgi:hypothetical protein
MRVPEKRSGIRRGHDAPRAGCLLSWPRYSIWNRSGRVKSNCTVVRRERCPMGGNQLNVDFGPVERGFAGDGLVVDTVRSMPISSRTSMTCIWRRVVISSDTVGHTCSTHCRSRRQRDVGGGAASACRWVHHAQSVFRIAERISVGSVASADNFEAPSWMARSLCRRN